MRLELMLLSLGCVLLVVARCVPGWWGTGVAVAAIVPPVIALVLQELRHRRNPL